MITGHCFTEQLLIITTQTMLQSDYHDPKSITKHAIPRSTVSHFRQISDGVYRCIVIFMTVRLLQKWLDNIIELLPSCLKFGILHRWWRHTADCRVRGTWDISVLNNHCTTSRVWYYHVMPYSFVFCVAWWHHGHNVITQNSHENSKFDRIHESNLDFVDRKSVV